MKGSKRPCLSHKFAALQHSHKKRTDCLKTRAVLLMFWLELEISGVAIQEIHQKNEKNACSEDFFLFFFFAFSFSVVIATAQRLLRQL